jgi:hypothetical protein
MFNNIISTASHVDKFGYYTVGDHKTYSKIEAIELHKTTRKHPHWNFNEDVFKWYNWKVEPTETLQELYAKRAWEIRKKYDHITIFYSGGADSGNVLNTFVDNNIPIDEVATMNYHRLDPRQDTYFHAEQVRVSYPRIKQLQDQGIKFKHKSIDLTDIVYRILTDPKLRNSLAYYSNTSFGITHLAVSFIRETDDEYLKLKEQGKKHAFIWAIEKPRVMFEQGKYCLRFIDMIDSGPSIRTQLLNRENEYDELFYWDPSCADMLCKQGHVLMNFLKRNQNLLTANKDIRVEDKKFKILEIENSFCKSGTSDGLSYREVLNWLIYPGFNPYTFSVGKPLSAVYSLRDEYWLKDRIYRESIDLCVQHLASLDPYWLKDPTDVNQGLKGMISDQYWLE